MNLSKRAQTVTAGAVLGLVAVATFAAPAVACYPVITPISSCVNENGTWVVGWQVANSKANEESDVKEVKAAPDDTISLTGIVAGAKIPAYGTLTGSQTLPATAETASISVTAHWISNYRDNYDTRQSKEISKPTEACRPPNSPSPSPSPSRFTPAREPQFVHDATCDSLTVGVKVPADWPKDLTVTFIPSTGQRRTVVGERGETTEVEFPASKGLKVTATAKGYEDEATTITYETPADCVPSLPVTGAAAGTIVGGATGLLAVGAVLFVLARRRKVKFTA